MLVSQTGCLDLVERVGDSRFSLASLGPADRVEKRLLLDGLPRAADAVVAKDATLEVIYELS